MNLTNFLKQTDAMTAKYTKEQLVAFIHDMGRVLPEGSREDFLKRLEAVSKNTEEKAKKDEEENIEFDEEYQVIRNNLKRIDSQEVTITGTLNEEYDDWYNSSADEFCYEDENGVSDMLKEACDFVHTCMDMGRYKEGIKIGQQLFYMEILCENEYGDEELSLDDMIYHRLLHYDLKQVILDTLYCAYFGTTLKERSERLFEIIKNANQNDITLEALMQHGDEELPDLQEFLMQWITYLGDKIGYDAERLILEAVGLLNNNALANQYAKKLVAVHPGLYLSMLESKESMDMNTKVSIGIEAINTIPKKYVVRSRVALKTAEYLIKAGKEQSVVEKCYFAAYESDTSAINYIRVLLNGYSTEEKREELRNVLEMLPTYKDDYSYSISGNDSTSERAENRPEDNMILLIRFLDGQFTEVLSKGLGTKEALGWSGTFMKQGIALYLLCLYEGQWKDKGIIEMSSIVKGAMGFSTEKYKKGFYGVNVTNENNLFFDLFSKWKAMVKMEPEVRICAMKKIAELLEKRTEGIMNANRRNYYGECASYIAALGEVQESLGDKGAKQRIMTSYKDKYFRRSAFRAELKEYGWMDIKGK